MSPCLASRDITGKNMPSVTVEAPNGNRIRVAQLMGITVDWRAQSAVLVCRRTTSDINAREDRFSNGAVGKTRSISIIVRFLLREVACELDLPSALGCIATLIIHLPMRPMGRVKFECCSALECDFHTRRGEKFTRTIFV